MKLLSVNVTEHEVTKTINYEKNGCVSITENYYQCR